MSTIPTVTPERHIVEMAENQTRGSRIRATSGRAPATVEGWLQKQGATWHYFRDGKSLCRQHDQGPHHLRPFLNGGAKSNACHLCERALAQRPTIQQRDAAIRALIVDAPPPEPAAEDKTGRYQVWTGVFVKGKQPMAAAPLADNLDAAQAYEMRRERVGKGFANEVFWISLDNRQVGNMLRGKRRVVRETQPIPPAAPEERDPRHDAAGRPRFINRDSVAASLDLLIDQEIRKARERDEARIKELEADVAALRKQLAGIRAALGAS